MSNKKIWKERLVLGKGQEFSAGDRFRGESVGDRTIIDLEALSHEYKLGQAYASVHNLEFRSEGPIKVQTFGD